MTKPLRPGLWPGSGPGSYQPGQVFEAMQAEAPLAAKTAAGLATQRKQRVRFGTEEGTMHGLSEKADRERKKRPTGGR